MSEYSDITVASFDTLEFFIFIVIVEHALLILKLILEQLIDDVPGSIQREMEVRQGYIKKFNDMIKDNVEMDFEDVNETRK